MEGRRKECVPANSPCAVCTPSWAPERKILTTMCVATANIDADLRKKWFKSEYVSVMFYVDMSHK